jgi:hypothetical protein
VKIGVVILAFFLCVWCLTFLNNVLTVCQLLSTKITNNRNSSTKWHSCQLSDSRGGKQCCKIVMIVEYSLQVSHLTSKTLHHPHHKTIIHTCQCVVNFCNLAVITAIDRLWLLYVTK